MQIHNFDIAIIGGGMVGLSLAASFENTNLRVAVIEGQAPDETLNDLPDNRVSALSRASETFLSHLGAWPYIESKRLAAYVGMQVWEKDSFAELNFNAQEIAQPNLGYIIENRVIHLALLEKVRSLSNVTIFMPERCQSLAVGEQEAWLTLSSGDALTTKLVVGADGANSWLRQQQDIPLTHWDYGHSAIVANILTKEPHQGIARQVFTPQGPVAMLPLTEPNLCSLVWSTDPERAQNLTNASAEEFNQALTVELDNCLGLCQVLGKRQSHPLKMRYARDFVRPRVALVGDAAHTIHPLAGQGVNLGFLDAASLAEEVKAIWQQGKDIGAVENLRAYERWRKAEAAKMIAAMQGFRDLFEGDNPAKKLVRSFGMSLFDKLPGAKDEMMKRALGLKGHLPQACRSQQVSTAKSH